MSTKEFALKKIKPITNLTQVDRVEMSLQEYFRSENLQPGDPIPKEIELAEALGVSRTAVREALSRFRLLGIIDSRKNRGMIITEPDILGNMERMLEPQLLQTGTKKEIFELRLIIEMGLADVLFLRKGDPDLKRLEDIVEKEEQTKNKSDKLKYDIEFHSMLYKMSGNKMVQRFQKALFPIFNYVNNELHVRSLVQDESYVSHRILLNILKGGTADEFRLKMRQHLMQYFEKISSPQYLQEDSLEKQTPKR